MSWVRESHPELLPYGTKVRVSRGENVLVGTIHGVGTTWITVNVAGFNEVIELRHENWEVATERTTFWDVMSAAAVGTIALKERGDEAPLVYHKTQAGVVNSETLHKVQGGSNVAQENAKSYEWYEPSVFTP